MENWRSQGRDSSSTRDNFISSISHLPQIYNRTPSSQNHFSLNTLQIPTTSHHPQNSQHYPTPVITQPANHTMSLEETMASLAAGQTLLVESLSRLLTRLDNHSSPQRTVDDLAAGIGNINLDRHIPPHQCFNARPQSETMNRPTGHGERPSYAPMAQQNYISDSPSEGAYARDPLRGDMGTLREPKIRDNLRFTGESRLLRQFLLDIYDVLEQFSNSFSSDKRKINWISAHFSTTTNDVSPSQSWFLSLLMKNAHIHGVMDQYANLKSLEYVIPPLLSTDAFIQELIFVFGDNTSSKTAREALSKCRQGNSSIVDYNARYTSLAFHVVQSEEDAILKYMAGLQFDIHMASIHLPGWTDAVTLIEKQTLAIRGAQIVDEIASVKGQSRKHVVYQHPNSFTPTPIPIPFKSPNQTFRRHQTLSPWRSML